MHCPDENVLAAFTDGVLGESEAGAVRAHVDRCVTCRAVLEQLGAVSREAGPGSPVGAPPSREHGELGLGTRVGRFLVLHPLGSGGMGVVYAAYDPELDRRVALKLVRPGRGLHKEGQRLLREAQAIARLSHPHVVSLFDVGTWGDEVFLAMEFVEGHTLTQWLKTGPARHEVLQAFLSAGEGLAAAHRAGLVHRDFKPDNVLVGRDGRVRVTDFGLARQVSEAAAGEVPPEAREPATGLLDHSLTGTGALVGTPAYMAPEQHARQAVDARGDQFAFCVTLWEALHGERPFTGQSAAEVAQAAREGRVGPSRREARVPERLRQLMLRGLSPRAEERFPSMEALLAVLRREAAGPRRRRWALAGAALLGALLAVTGLVTTGARARLMCSDTGAALVGTWDGERRERIRQAFEKTGVPYARVAFDSSTRVLDAYAQDWTRARVEACEATHVRGEQSEALLDARMQCLHERRLALGSLSELFASANKALVGRALQVAEALPAVEDCAQRQALSVRLPPPQQPEARQQMEAAQARLARAAVLRPAGRHADALKEAEAAVAVANALGYAPLQAEAFNEQAANQSALQRLTEAEDSLYQALQHAQAGRHDRVAALASRQLMLLLGSHLRQHAQARRWGELARAFSERAGEGPGAEPVRLSYLAAIFYNEERQEEAIAHYTRALDLYQQRPNPKGVVVSQWLNNLGNCLIHLGRSEEALERLRQALALRERDLGPDHPQVAATLSNMAQAMVSQGRAPEAVPLGERALAIAQRALGPEAHLTANMLEALAQVYSRSGRLDQAVEMMERARAFYEKQLGPHAPVLSRVNSNLGGILLMRKDAAGALVPLRRALAIDEKVLDADHPDIAEVRSQIAAAYLALGRVREARELLERAMRSMEDKKDGGYVGQVRAQVELRLGQALWREGRERGRARALVQESLTRSRAAHDSVEARETVAEAEQWLAAHPAR